MTNAYGQYLDKVMASLFSQDGTDEKRFVAINSVIAAFGMKGIETFTEEKSVVFP